MNFWWMQKQIPLSFLVLNGGQKTDGLVVGGEMAQSLCDLHRNSAGHSWDCSCRGSRFNEHRQLIDHAGMGGSHGE